MLDKFELQAFAVPSVSILIAFLSYASQLLFLHLEPGKLDQRQQWTFNVLVGCIWVTYIRAIKVNPGRVPGGWTTQQSAGEKEDHVRQRYCRKCEAQKPPRSHHCKICKRCIPKMDHHCPWTNNCVSFFTFPHFMRFLSYAVSTMVYLEYLLWIRMAHVWNSRTLPSYLGPSVTQLTLLFVLVAINTLTLFAVSTIFVRSVYDLCCNTTTIETWEIDRHEQLLRRARVLGGYLDGPDGMRIRLKRQEFPYDIGIWSNMCQGMGSKNFVAWFWPFSQTPRDDGLSFETNGFEDSGTSWPPPDPDRMPRLQRQPLAGGPFTYGEPQLTPAEELASFERRRQADYDQRFGTNSVLRRKPFYERFDIKTSQPLSSIHVENDDGSGEESWQDFGGSRLRDYGVDEQIEFYDEEEEKVTLAEIIKRRGTAHKS